MTKTTKDELLKFWTVVIIAIVSLIILGGNLIVRISNQC